MLDASNSYYEKSLRELVGIEVADKMVSELSIIGKVKKYPEELEAPFYFGDVRFRWDPNKKAYVSYGDLGIANINKRQVMKYVKGKIVISKRLTGNDITIYLQLDEKNYYYFNYKRGLMQVFSSNEEFNTIISETKKDETKFKGEKDQEDFQFMLGTPKLVAPLRLRIWINMQEIFEFNNITAVLLAYLIGSIPSAIWVSKWFLRRC